MPSGHGQAGEFTPNISYTAKVNGNLVGGNPIWKDDCGFNAIWPQGGTWIFDRANWCPGEAVPILTTKSPPISIAKTPQELILILVLSTPMVMLLTHAVQLFQYKEPTSI